MKKIIVFTGLLALILSMVANLPASLLQQWLSSEEDAVIFYGVSGTLASGKAVAADFGRLRLQNAVWTINPWGLLRASISHDVNADSDLGPVGLTLEKSLFGALSLRNIQGLLPAADLISSARIPAPPMEGAVQLNVAQLRVSNNTLNSIEGDITVRGLTWSLSRPPLLLGSYSAILTTDDDGVQARISDNKAALQAKGELTLAEDGAYTVDLRLRPADSADPGVANLLRPLGAPEAGGWNRIKQSGDLTPASS